jgi:hypothetical protein
MGSWILSIVSKISCVQNDVSVYRLLELRVEGAETGDMSLAPRESIVSGSVELRRDMPDVMTGESKA